MHQADPLNEEEVLNQREQRIQIKQEDYKFFTYAQSYNYVKRVTIQIRLDLVTSLTICSNVSFDSGLINK